MALEKGIKSLNNIFLMNMVTTSLFRIHSNSILLNCFPSAMNTGISTFLAVIAY